MTASKEAFAKSNLSAFIAWRETERCAARRVGTAHPPPLPGGYRPAAPHTGGPEKGRAGRTRKGSGVRPWYTLSVVVLAVLGALQGATEFLPVSSSGHLVLAQWLLGVQRPGVSLELALHAGTLGAVVAVFGGRLYREGRRLLVPLVVATLPAGVAGLLLRPLLEAAFRQPAAVALGWLATAAALRWAAARTPGRRQAGGLRIADGLVIGACQAVALVPGISRAGAALVGGLAVGLEPAEAAAFAFLLALPTVGGAALLEAPAWRGDPLLWLGAGVAGLAGAVAMRWFLRAPAAGRLRGFSAYCTALGLGTLLGLAAGWMPPV